MDAYLASTKSSELDRRFDIRDKHTWEEVMRTAIEAEQVYQEKAKGKSGLVRRAWRNIGDSQSVINPWLELLPNGEYSSIICSGLKLVFTVRRLHSAHESLQISKIS